MHVVPIVTVDHFGAPPVAGNLFWNNKDGKYIKYKEVTVKDTGLSIRVTVWKNTYFLG